MKNLFPFSLLLLLLVSACGEEDPITLSESDITISGENLDFATAFVSYANIEPPGASRINLELLGPGATFTAGGEITNTPTDRLRLRLVVPNTEGTFVSGTYPVSISLPTESMYVTNGTLFPNFSATSQDFRVVETGSIEVTINNDRVTLTIDIGVSSDFGAPPTERIIGTTELPLIIRP